jgi:hypothetical protein
MMPFLPPSTLSFLIWRDGKMPKDPDEDPIEVCLMIGHDDEIGREREIRSISFRIRSYEEILER